MIEIYTDGAYDPVSERGGWGAVIVENGRKQSLSGVVEGTTNNRMEITAALEAIQRTPANAELTVYTDSQYLYGCVAKGWQRKANRDLWEKLDEVASTRRVQWRWLSGETANEYHREAHALANGLVAGGGEAGQAGTDKMESHADAAGVSRLTHVDEAGRPRMVDVSAKPETKRQAVAKGLVRMQPTTFRLIKSGGIAKGDVLPVAQLAGIMAAKRTPELIPLCHPILIDSVSVEFEPDEANSTISITATVRSTGRTGVEMEAMTAVSVAALTIYDMCKAVDRGMRIEDLRLVHKSGGKSGTINLE